MYLLWFDDTNRKTTPMKVLEAVAAYERHFKRRPNLVLMHESEQVPIDGMTTRVETFVRRNNFWIGHEELDKAA
jgi:hypothetical protein